MDIVVQKFGGTSVENKEKLGHVIEKIEKALNDGNNVVVVVSAQGKTTDKLIQKAKEYVDKTYEKEMDLLLSTGEILTVSLLTMMLKNKGIDAIGLTGSQAGIITDSNFSFAKIKMVMSENILKYLESGKVVVVAGFQGIDKFGNITTLGRGGSDLSAVAIAASLSAKQCEIYTDVDGVFSTDPNIIDNAKLLRTISYNEMLEAATAGSKVLHNRAVSMAKKYKLRVKVKNARTDECGTEMYLKNNINEECKPKILAIENNLAKITIVGENLLSDTSYITKIYSLANKYNISVYMISISETCIGIVIRQSDALKFGNILHENVILEK